MTEDPTTGADFGRATASWFGLDVDKVTGVQFSNPTHEPLTVTITIQINPDDIAGIGKRMKEIAAGSKGIMTMGDVISQMHKDTEDARAEVARRRAERKNPVPVPKSGR